MKGMRIGLVLGCVMMVAACVPKRQPPPPTPTPSPAPRVQQPRPAPPPAPALANWRDRPLTPGAWVYRRTGDTSQALFGAANSEAQFAVRCDRVRRQVSLWREGGSSTPGMVVRTTGLSRSFPASIQAEPLAYVWTALPASDRFLEEIVFSRGRFTVEVPGLPMLVIPTWPEPARVIEDCRG